MDPPLLYFTEGVANSFKMIFIGGGLVFLIYLGWPTWNSKRDTNNKETARPFSPRKQIEFESSRIFVGASVFGYALFALVSEPISGW
ncbi:hypothetical protein DNHGIG_17560 [Collibacillus ludicampi]|uniref:Uncharacterized protein n=1 Tax=Collibacillus ludicampi TaxID=2771369 RepID=A0AAV4LEE8_9BACL|nr:hypothetical protein [Collibacillus ludicampi]GIM46207.1 hypothetical protein DNHGIG_17560 [Collibacillus ludicampi]